MANPQRSPAEIYATAAARPNSQVDAIFYPNPQSGAWRVRLHEDGKAEPVMITINDRGGAVSTIDPLSGDRVASWIRWLHEGSHSGEIWRFVVFVSGIMPALLGITGILIWLRQRRQRALVMANTPRVSTSKSPGSVGDAAPGNSRASSTPFASADGGDGIHNISPNHAALPAHGQPQISYRE